MNRRRRRTALAALVGLALIWGLLVGLRFLMSQHDYERVLRGRRPTFARQIWFLSDGGTVAYRGLGYDLTAHQRFHVKDGLPLGYDRGPILEYWLNWLLLPLSDKKEIRFEPMENPPRRSGSSRSPSAGGRYRATGIGCLATLTRRRRRGNSYGTTATVCRRPIGTDWH